YPGRVDLFLAEEPYPTVREDTRLRWRDVVRLAKVYRFPGDHEALLKDPQGSPLSEKINAALRSGFLTGRIPSAPQKLSAYVAPTVGTKIPPKIGPAGAGSTEMQF